MIIWRIMLIVLTILFLKFDRPDAISLFSALFSRSFLSYTLPGIILTVSGLITALWARIFLGRNWSNYITYKKEHELITTGPYKLLRHPIYSGTLLMLAGTFLYYGNLIILIILMMFAAMVAWRMSKEEEAMTELFGEKYADYMKRTKRLVPWIY